MTPRIEWPIDRKMRIERRESIWAQQDKTDALRHAREQAELLKRLKYREVTK